MIYLDNAATGGFKPSAVTEAAINAIKYLNANPGRSGHELAVKAQKAVYETRKTVADLFGANVERVVFTQNCTAAINAAIYGMYERGGRVLTSVTEHNSVLRPLYDLESRNEISLGFVKPASTLSGVTAKDVGAALTPDTNLVVLSAASNVSGAPNDIFAVGKLLEKRNIK